MKIQDVILRGCIVLSLGVFVFGQSAHAQELVILHSNDTHSQITPDSHDLGGVVRRKVVVDSVRASHPNVLLVDAGDAVQGTLYFTLFGGEVESKVMNALGYDIQILGNHEFDNGLEQLARHWSQLQATRLSTNYHMDGTPMQGLLSPYCIKAVEDKRVGFIAINIDPRGMIADKNAVGVEYLDPLKAANSTAWHLKHNERVDLVVALTHIGNRSEHRFSDVDLARESEDIDIIIGGHSHTLVDPNRADTPSWFVDNAVGVPVLVVQAGAGGAYIGKVVVDLTKGDSDCEVIRIDKRLDDRLDSEMLHMLKPYADSIAHFTSSPIAVLKQPLHKRDQSMLNWMADFVLERANNLPGHPNAQIAIVNKGGIRGDWAKGKITRGSVMQVFPFDNRIVVLQLTGGQLLDALNVMAARGGDGVSNGVDVTFDADGRIQQALLQGVPIDPNAIYRLATIDYLANGGDYMTPLRKATMIEQSPYVLYSDIINALSKGGFMHARPIRADKTERMHLQ